MRDDFVYPKIDLGIMVSDGILERLNDYIPQQKMEEYVAERMKLIRKDKMWLYARQNFKNEDESPWEMSPGELELYKMIALRKYTRNQVVTSTQYGKTLTIARAVLTRIATYPEEWMTVAPDLKRGKILINYIIKDTANNEYFKNKLVGLDIGEKSALNRLLEEKSKAKLTYQMIDDDGVQRYGSVEIITADARRKENAINTIMGFGGRNIIADESALEVDEVDAGIFRMLAGKGADTFLMKIGNPFFRNHFLKSWKDKRYKKVYVDYAIGLAEGRYTQDFIDEALEKPKAGVLWRCQFPKATDADKKGWTDLLTEEEIRLAMQTAPHFGEERMGVDFADEGVDSSSIVKRSAGYAEILYSSDEIDLMDFVGEVILRSPEINSKKIYGDRVGVGAGGVSRLREVNRTEKENKLKITGVSGAEKSIDPRFANKRAEMFWRLREWIKSGGKLSEDDRWFQLSGSVKYKVKDSTGKIIMMGKEDMRKDGINSPDEADALSTTFYDPTTAIAALEEDRFFMRKMREKNRKRKSGSGYKLRPTR